MQRVMPLSSPRIEYNQPNESMFRADVYRALISLQQRLDELQLGKSNELSKMSLRRNLSTPSIGVVTNGGGEGWGY